MESHAQSPDQAKVDEEDYIKGVQDHEDYLAKLDSIFEEADPEVVAYRKRVKEDE